MVSCSCTANIMLHMNAETASLPSWNPQRFLTVAETMHGVSIGYDWFYHELSHSQRTAIEDGLYRAGLEVGLACWRLNCSWTPGIPDAGTCSRCWYATRSCMRAQHRVADLLTRPC